MEKDHGKKKLMILWPNLYKPEKSGKTPLFLSKAKDLQKSTEYTGIYLLTPSKLTIETLEQDQNIFKFNNKDIRTPSPTSF